MKSAHDYEGDEIEEFECEICQKKFPYFSRLKNHMKIFHNIDELEKISTEEDNPDRKYQCKFCEKKFKSLIYRRNHMKSVHDYEGEIETTYNCEICGKKFPHMSRLKKHMEVRHNENGNKEMKCNLCQKILKTSGHLNRHMREVHEKIKVHIRRVFR